HPLVSAFFCVPSENHFSITGDLWLKSKFLGNSVSMTTKGKNRITAMVHGRTTYVITVPKMYVCGILSDEMVIELSNACTAHNDAYDLHANLCFKTKAFFSATYNAILGHNRHCGTELSEVSGKWSA
ncbi:hypothetical protein EI94DRAFT_1586733, partial [Lactarius quietus]